MGVLKKYQKGGEFIGTDPSTIPQDIIDLSRYSGDVKPMDHMISQPHGYKHNTIPGEFESPARRYFKAASITNKKPINRSKTTQSKDKEVIDGKWHNFSVEDGYNSLKEGDKVKVGDATIKVTGGYGLRNLKGRKEEHSRGIDITTSTGKAHALSDGVIESVLLEGDGSKVGTGAKPAAGYYVVVRNSDGTKTQYMHLDPMTETDIKNLKGKKLKRGDEIWGYTTGSGSMTAPHVKVRHYGTSSKYNVDPSQLIQGIAYKYIPDGEGNNIFSYKQKKKPLLKS